MGQRELQTNHTCVFGASLACRVFLVFSQGIMKERERASFRKIKIQMLVKKGVKNIDGIISLTIECSVSNVLRGPEQFTYAK